MHFYLRFLKLPVAKPQRNKDKTTSITISTVITVATDLGETFYPHDLPLRISIRGTSSTRPLLIAKDLQWTAGSRDLSVQLLFSAKLESQFVACLSCLDADKRADDIRKYDAEKKQEGVLSAWSMPFGKNEKAEGYVERKLQISSDKLLSVWEETGESIARHIWAGGLALTSYFTKYQSQKGQLLSFHDVMNRGTEQHIIELGTGCGIVGLALASIYPSSKITITDLPLAEPIVQKNLDIAKLSNIKFQALDWCQPWSLQDVDIIVVADCVYNTDTIPLLVNVLHAMTKQWPEVVIIMSHKKRHNDEILFFNMMLDAQFSVQKRLSYGTGKDTVNLYEMSKSKKDTLYAMPIDK